MAPTPAPSKKLRRERPAAPDGASIILAFNTYKHSAPDGASEQQNYQDVRVAYRTT